MSDGNNVLQKMLDRLLAALVNGPGLNCRPYASRQRLDLSQVSRLKDISPEQTLRDLLGEAHRAMLKAKVPMPKGQSGGKRAKRSTKPEPAGESESAQTPNENGDPAAPAEAPQRPSDKAWIEQQAVFTKLRTIAEDARTYEQDTGVSVLNLGFPLLSLPPGAFGAGSARRVLAPIAFLPVSLALKRGATQSADLTCRGAGIDLVVPNTALLAWIEQQTGKSPEQLDADEEGQNPWREICSIVAFVCDALDVALPEMFKPPAIAEQVRPTSQQTEAQATPIDKEGTTDDVSAGGDATAENDARGKSDASAMDDASAGASSRSSGTPGEGGGGGRLGNAPVVPTAPTLTLPRSTGGGDMIAASNGSSRPEHDDPEKPGGINPALHKEATGSAGVAPQEQACRRAGFIPPPAAEKPAPPDPLETLKLVAAPKSEESPDEPAIICSAVLGLFPMANQGLLRDTQAMLAGEGRGGPVESFLKMGLSLETQPVPAEQNAPPPPAAGKNFAQERLVTVADPCQARAVRLARECNGLVVHGPPGTGKSQTITNIIGDHLARGQRVLLVCDKRTALDVVAHRLEHMGLGKLCAQVYDPRRDQRDLYKSIREQLDELPQATSASRAEGRLAKVDAELRTIHDQLSNYRESLTEKSADHGRSFHELVGQWLSLVDVEEIAGPANSDGQAVPPEAIDLSSLREVALAELDQRKNQIADLLKRADSVQYSSNPWVGAAGISLADFLALPMDRVRALAASPVEPARQADATRDPEIPPFAPDVPLARQAASRVKLADDLSQSLAKVEPAILSRWADASGDELRRAKLKLTGAQAFVQTLRGGPIDAELALSVRDRQLSIAEIGQQLSALAAYLQVADKWYAFLPLKPKKPAAAVLTPFGLTLSSANARRLQQFLNALRARLALTQLVLELSKSPASKTPAVMADDMLDRAIDGHSSTLDFLIALTDDAGASPLRSQVSSVLKEPQTAGPFISGLRKSPARAAALEKLETVATQCKLFAAPWLAMTFTTTRAGEGALPMFEPLAQRVDTLEGVLRTTKGLAELPPPIHGAVSKLVLGAIAPDRAMTLLYRESTAGEITRRIGGDPTLQAFDNHELQAAFDRYSALAEQKHELVRDVILHRWITTQKERLLAATGSRMNSAGADLRRRLTIRGERAMRLRQVVAVGSKMEGGDPLFDMCPIWLCSPETVAQVFPRQAVFDAVIFDEASQCRLEEAIPVVVRGRRLVIAGDPKQLPPTRFFESAIAASEEEEAQNDQELFEQHQGEVEDLLAASLGLDIQQSYLDVHYRSRNPDLIAFSNEHFYGSRLQPIPGRAIDSQPPVRLERVDGIYDKRRNEAEAQRVTQIVAELLAGDDPPSIGIACFNLPQRDLIVEKLDELAANDSAFAKRLDAARTRAGAGSFEGLFIKNLENVQGDERDHIIISTTYGPDGKGKFYRRFGPLGMAGGGRRLNVLVTRARKQVHLVTSIPPEQYRTLPELPSGTAPGGGWLLFAYLQYAQRLEGIYAALSAKPQAAENATPAAATAPPQPPPVAVQPTQRPSTFVESLARHLAQSHGVGSDVYWGNDGFCVDLALRHPQDPLALETGIVCDAARFTPGDDPIDWDVFRTGILQSQGWRLERLWTPHFFRDPRGMLATIAKPAQ